MKKSFDLTGSLTKTAVILVLAGGLAVFAYQTFLRISTEEEWGFV